jgi:hypothetical protein
MITLASYFFFFSVFFVADWIMTERATLLHGKRGAVFNCVKRWLVVHRGSMHQVS